MRRYLLRQGDKSTHDGVVIEGMERCTHHGRPLTFIGAKVLCPVCKSTGVIGWKGPHRSATMMGKQQALDGDICICKCDPPPVMIASQDTAWHEFAAHELEPAHAATYDEQFTLMDDASRPLANVRYRIVTESGQVYTGITNAAGQTRRVTTNETSRLKLQLVKE
ncbi:PAAR domain-containing protein [Paraburkholderia caffeinitolerans]|uniref:PAAR domain-containing protein n=1 Tax=Paraburkholderia caffeinitolerans TaxID=1723730 RepID=UPI001583743D|nr:PAAR domain-containing protein [Paraburkholderia caffeinitolerans]